MSSLRDLRQERPPGDAGHGEADVLLLVEHAPGQLRVELVAVLLDAPVAMLDGADAGGDGAGQGGPAEDVGGGVLAGGAAEVGDHGTGSPASYWARIGSELGVMLPPVAITLRKSASSRQHAFRGPACLAPRPRRSGRASGSGRCGVVIGMPQERMSGPSASPRRMRSRTSWTMPSLAAAVAHRGEAGVQGRRGRWPGREPAAPRRSRGRPARQSPRWCRGREKIR